MWLPHVLSALPPSLLCQGMCGLSGPSTPVIPLPSALLLADIPQMLLTSSLVPAKESWAVRGMFLRSSYGKSTLQQQQHGWPRLPLGMQRIFLSFSRMGALECEMEKDWGDFTVSLKPLTSGSSGMTSLWS